MPKNREERPVDWRRLNEVFETAVELPSSERSAFLSNSCGNDDSLRLEAERLLRAAQAINENSFLTGDAFEVGARVIAETSDVRGCDESHFGKFKIVSEIARGGMGTVYLAERDDFQQRVALKLIRDGFDSAETLRRFRIERDVLASLSHPNIARLLDGGTTDDGQPFLAIEYVEGERIDAYCDSHELDLTQRLTLFRKVCAAVAYAHQNLTVHRDLKPSNILVTTDGEPKLLDFGIAKLLAGVGPTDETATADRLLTPEYASPEQLRGEKISTASDVYSLGVLLFELLTARRPFELKDRSAFEIVDAVCNTEAPTPSNVNGLATEHTEGLFARIVSRKRTRSAVSSPASTPGGGAQSILSSQLKGDLDNIILTALRKDPERRYSSVEQLSEDIRRHLVGLPIVARPLTFRYRASKFVRRNRLPVAFASIAGLALIVGAGIASWQAVVARREAAIAKQRFDDVRTLANTFVGNWDKDIPEETISPEIHGRLADISSDYLSRLAVDTDDPELLRETAEAQIMLGHQYAYFMIDNDKARRSLRSAEEIARRLVAADPDNERDRSLLVQSLMKYVEFFGSEDLNAALASRTEQIMLRKKNLERRSDDVDELRAIAVLSAQIGDNLKPLGREGEAQLAYADADRYYERRIEVLTTSPPTVENLARLSGTLSSRGMNATLNMNTSSVPSEELMMHAIDAAERAVATAPADRSANIALIAAYLEAGNFFARQGADEKAIVVLRASLEANRKYGYNREDGYFNRQESDALLQLADSQHQLGRDTAAMESLNECFQIRRQFSALAKNRDSYLTPLGHGSVFDLGGRLLARMGRRAESDAAFDESEDFLRRTPIASQHQPRVGYQLASVMIDRGDSVAGLFECRRRFSELAELDGDCATRVLRRSHDRRQRATVFYRQAVEFIDSLPENIQRTYGDLEMVRVANSRLEAIQ